MTMSGSPPPFELHPRTAALYEQAVVLFERSAELLEDSGDRHSAEQARRRAARARRLLAGTSPERVAASARLPALQAMLEGWLDRAMRMLAADLGDIQVYDARTGNLVIVAHRGLAPEFLDHFAVDPSGATCTRAAQTHTQIVVPDLALDPAFRRHVEIAAAAGVSAVQSTPLIDPAGRLRGVISTHFRRPHHPSGPELRRIQTHARVAADAIARAVDGGSLRIELSHLGRAVRAATNAERLTEDAERMAAGARRLRREAVAMRTPGRRFGDDEGGPGALVG